MKKDKNISLFSVSFKQGFVSPKIPIATFTQGNKKLNFLLDSGSDKNVLNKAALSEIEHVMDEGNTVNLSGVGGVSEVGACKVKFNCGEESYEEDFLVADLGDAFGLIENDHCITIHGILGSIFLRANNIVMDFQNLVAYSAPK